MLKTAEFFLTTDGKLLVNELAPRPHNSGHLTIDAHTTCQFEQQADTAAGVVGADEVEVVGGVGVAVLGVVVAADHDLVAALAAPAHG